MGVTRQAGPGMLLPPSYAAYNRNASVSFSNVPSGPISLPAGATQLLPAGSFVVQPGPYTFVQVKDPITGTWRTLGTAQHDAKPVLSDGQNVRLANLSGCAAGALITNVGSGYTSTPTVTASAGSSSWRAVVGGAVSTTVTITSAGSGFSYPPTLVVEAPPTGGVQATAVATITAGAISAVTVVNQGAGYTTAPAIAVIPDPRDTTGSGGTLTTTLTGSGVVTAILCTDHGTPLTSVPTLTISGGGGASAAATAVMCFSLTGYSVGTAGAAYGNAQPILTMAVGGVVAGTPGAVVNPALSTGMFAPRTGLIVSTSTAGGALTTGGVIQDGGLFQAVPASVSLAGNGVPTTQAVATLAVGGVTDTSYVYPI